MSDNMGSAFLTEGGCGSVTIDVEGIDIMLSAPEYPIDQGESDQIQVMLSTPHDVYGIELHITDSPESITAYNVVEQCPDYLYHNPIFVSTIAPGSSTL